MSIEPWKTIPTTFHHPPTNVLVSHDNLECATQPAAVLIDLWPARKGFLHDAVLEIHTAQQHSWYSIAVVVVCRCYCCDSVIIRRRDGFRCGRLKWLECRWDGITVPVLPGMIKITQKQKDPNFDLIWANLNRCGCSSIDSRITPKPGLFSKSRQRKVQAGSNLFTEENIVSWKWDSTWRRKDQVTRPSFVRAEWTTNRWVVCIDSVRG